MIKAEELIALATAHGIDLKHVAGNASDTEGIAKQRKRTAREVELGIEVVPTARGRSSRTYRRPAWSLAELGQAASGADMPEIPWLAARYSFAGDRHSYWPIWEALMYQAGKLARREGWKPMVAGRLSRHPKTGKPIPGQRGEPVFYRAELCQLVLDVDAHRWVFMQAPGMYAILMRVEEETWSQVLAARFEALQGKYESWLETARSLIQRELARREDRESA